MRWTMRKSCWHVTAENDLMGLRVIAAKHNIGKKGLEFNLFVNGTLLDHIHFF